MDRLLADCKGGRALSFSGIRMRDPQVLPIVVWPSDRLKEVSRALTVDDIQNPETQLLVEDMLTTLYAHRAVGLAAVQVGRPLRLFVMDADGGPIGMPISPHVLINPSLAELGGEPKMMMEGCLSVPGVTEKVERHPLAIVECTLLTFDHGPVITQFEGLEAQCVQHEIEHLDGMVLPDKFGPVTKDLIKRKVRKYLNSRK